MAKESSDWRGRDWANALPMWSPEHPLYVHLGATLEIASVGHAYCDVMVPALDDPALREIIALFGAGFTGAYYKAQRTAPTIALEAVARRYYYLCLANRDEPEPEKWREYLEKLGIKITPQSRNEFIAFLKWFCGDALDASGRLSKMASALAEWVEIYDHDYVDDDEQDRGWPNPVYDDIPGTSVFATWMLGERGYIIIAKARGGRLAEAGAADNSESVETIPPTPEPEPSAEVSPTETDDKSAEDRKERLRLFYSITDYPADDGGGSR